ncbi:MAG TPA: hypothetical protein VE778_01375 [Candidatus Bathyarchaeia archaeon]|nr:hypothetical protein [Candidatus Bathyarchaeia archaeon]
MSGTGAAIGSIIAFLLIGHFSDARQAAAAHSFDHRDCCGHGSFRPYASRVAARAQYSRDGGGASSTDLKRAVFSSGASKK